MFIHCTLMPKCVTHMLPDLQHEHNSDKACYEDAKYPICFILTLFRWRSSILKFDLIYSRGPIIRTHFRSDLMILYTKFAQYWMENIVVVFLS